jgi:hypothetical protein
MARSAIAKAEAAAEAVEAFLRGRLRAKDDATAIGPPSPASAEVLLSEDLKSNAETIDAAGHNQKAAPGPAGAIGLTPVFRLPHTDWLHHRLTVTGPAKLVTALQEAARGAGTIPWQLDMTSLEEDWFHRPVDPVHRSLSLQGARILAAQLREAVERRHALAVTRVGHSRACPFDLHTLVPVPPASWTSAPMTRPPSAGCGSAGVRPRRSAMSRLIRIRPVPGASHPAGVGSCSSGRPNGPHGAPSLASEPSGRHSGSTCNRATSDGRHTG